MPGLLDILHPLLADSSGPEKLDSGQIGEDMAGEEVTGDVLQSRGPIEALLVLVLDRHDVVLTHFELDEPLRRTVLQTVPQGQG